MLLKQLITNIEKYPVGNVIKIIFYLNMLDEPPRGSYQAINICKDEKTVSLHRNIIYKIKEKAHGKSIFLHEGGIVYDYYIKARLNGVNSGKNYMINHKKIENIFPKLNCIIM